MITDANMFLALSFAEMTNKRHQVGSHQAAAASPVPKWSGSS